MNRRIWTQILRNHGRYEDDPQVLALYTYANMFNGGLSFKVIYDQRGLQSFMESDCVTGHRLAWHRNAGITPYGKSFLEERGNDSETDS